MPYKKAVIILVLGLFVSACASHIRSDVSRFHRLPPPSGETFLIVPKDDAKKGGLEFGQYAGLIRARLMDVGYTPVTEGTPDLVVRVEYAISDGEERVRTRPGLGLGYGYAFHHYHYPYWPGWDYYSPEVYSYAVFTRKLEMDIVRADGEVLFEGRSLSVGRDNRLQAIMPYLVQAMFTNFPGESGVTNVVKIELPGGDSY